MFILENRIKYYLFIAILLVGSISFPSCTRKYGCPGETSVVNMDKEGELPSKRGKSKLFNKKMTKKGHTKY